MNLPSFTLPDASKPIEEQDLLVLFAMCLFGEARGETDTARRAVAQVILNRATHPRLLFGSKSCAQFEANLRGVILRPGQFSSLNPGDPNYPVVWNPLAHAAPEVWQLCLDCASQALAAKDLDDTLTSNSDHYFDDSILPPTWASPAKQTVKIGRLNFFRLYLPHPADSTPAGAPPSAGSSPDVSLRTGLSERIDTKNSAAFLHHGSHHSAKILPELAMTLPAAAPTRAGSEPAGPEDTPATGPQSPRPPMSSPAPKSSCAQICGPRSYSPYGWGRRLSHLFGNVVRRLRSHRRSSVAAGILCSGPFHQIHDLHHASKVLAFAATLAFALLATACSDLERSAFRVLAVTQAEYETIQDKVAESAARGLITEEQWDRFQVLGHRFIAAHNSAVDAFALWSKTKQPADTARLQAMLDLLPKLIVDINALVDTFNPPAAAPLTTSPSDSVDLLPIRAALRHAQGPERGRGGSASGFVILSEMGSPAHSDALGRERRICFFKIGSRKSGSFVASLLRMTFGEGRWAKRILSS